MQNRVIDNQICISFVYMTFEVDERKGFVVTLERLEELKTTREFLHVCLFEELVLF